MQALILAAGKGTRLKEMTKDMTKCMVEINGESIIKRLLKQLDNKGLSKIVIVVGFLAADLAKYINDLYIRTPIEFINNPQYESTNNIYSFALAEQCLCEDDTFLFESDLLLENKIVDRIFETPEDSFALVDKFDETWMDGTCVRINNNNEIIEFIPKSDLKYIDKNEYYKTVNVYKFSRDFCKDVYLPELFKYMDEFGMNDYYERVLQEVIKKRYGKLSALIVSNEKWYEVDTQSDLAQAKKLFSV